MKNEYIVHAGVKGMKWGVRKAAKNVQSKLVGSTTYVSRKTGLSTKAKAKQQAAPTSKARSAARIAAVGATAVGGVMAYKALSSMGMSKVSKSVNSKVGRRAIAGVMAGAGFLATTNLMSVAGNAVLATTPEKKKK